MPLTKPALETTDLQTGLRFFAVLASCAFAGFAAWCVLDFFYVRFGWGRDHSFEWLYLFLFVASTAAAGFFAVHRGPTGARVASAIGVVGLPGGRPTPLGCYGGR